jgi:hypothetical protein
MSAKKIKDVRGRRIGDVQIVENPGTRCTKSGKVVLHPRASRELRYIRVQEEDGTECVILLSKSAYEYGKRRAEKAAILPKVGVLRDLFD